MVEGTKKDIFFPIMRSGEMDEELGRLAPMRRRMLQREVHARSRSFGGGALGNLSNSLVEVEVREMEEMVEETEKDRRTVEIMAVIAGAYPLLIPRC
jgi:hypothetical protein